MVCNKSLSLARFIELGILRLISLHNSLSVLPPNKSTWNPFSDNKLPSSTKYSLGQRFVKCLAPGQKPIKLLLFTILSDIVLLLNKSIPLSSSSN